MKEKGFWDGVQAAVPTALGYVSIGLACGIIGSPYVTPVEMGLMSLFVYAGSAQFAMIALIAVQAPVAAIAMTVFLINLRLFLLSLHASTYFRHTSLWHNISMSSLWHNISMSSLLTDETYGVLMGELVHTDKVNPMWMHGNNLNSYISWFLGTVVGTALGGLLPNPEVFGLDFALVGMFIGIFTSQFQIMQKRIPLRNLFIILGVVAVSFFVLLTVVSQSLAVLFATLLGCTMGVILDGQ
ncbi:AzlC family ABC transporter permease [Streptococcus infantis]|uniref:AzlC family ABC transporter permease n=1 Tax=Streptococcus infantis TaxID=68892 RepID=UPI0039C2C87C